MRKSRKKSKHSAVCIMTDAEPVAMGYASVVYTSSAVELRIHDNTIVRKLSSELIICTAASHLSYTRLLQNSVLAAHACKYRWKTNVALRFRDGVVWVNTHSPDTGHEAVALPFPHSRVSLRVDMYTGRVRMDGAPACAAVP